MKQFHASRQGVFSTSINQDTIDEVPYADKSWESIESELKEMFEVREILHPIYKLKAAE